MLQLVLELHVPAASNESSITPSSCGRYAARGQSARPRVSGRWRAIARAPADGPRQSEPRPRGGRRAAGRAKIRKAVWLNAAARAVEETTNAKMGKFTAGMPSLPGGMKLPF